MIRKTLSLALVFSVTWTTCWAVAPVVAQAPPPAVTSPVMTPELVEEHRALVEELCGTIDRSQFDLEALGDKLGWDPEVITQFVRDEIEFEQYPGLLRGAEGTLMSRAGNSLDQAVLLGKMLKDGGLDARIARTELTLEQAKSLLSQMKPRRNQAPPPADVERWNKISSQRGEAAPPTTAVASPASGPEIDLALETANLLERALEEGRIGAPQEPTPFAEEARDYYWVEYRESASGPWSRTHPAFSEIESAPSELAASEHFTEQIPSELQHQFRLEVFIERRELDRLEVHQVVPAWQRPAANMLARSFSVFNYPNGLKGELFDLDLQKALAESELFVPIFNGEILSGTMGFDLDGVPYDLEAQGLDTFGASPLFRTVGEKVDRAVGALQGLGSDEPAPERVRFLTAEWVDYTLIAPGGEETVFRRYLLDRIGPAARLSGNVSEIPLERAQPWQLLASDEFMLAGGSYPEALVLDEFLHQSDFRFRLLREFQETGSLSMRSFDRLLGQGRGPDASTLLALFHSFDTGLAGRVSADTYRPEPSLLALHWEPKTDATARLSTDIMSNSRRSRAQRDIHASRRDVRLQGVWETVAERRAFGLLGLPATTLETPFSGLEDEEETSATIRLIGPDQSDGLAALALTDDQKVLLQHDLHRGFAIALVAADSPNDLTWWRLDSETGTALGMLSDGRGATATEYVLVFSLIAGVLLVVLGHSSIKCALENNHRTQSKKKLRPLECCYLDQITPDGSYPETVVFKWAMATDHLKKKVGMDEELCKGN